jgi:hypothetical protein
MCSKVLRDGPKWVFGPALAEIECVKYVHNAAADFD